ncbi:hypothetical protein [Microbulbifer hydrolyticus]|uniref:Uncharacterized protein n=1 Tax=Microbulbifer hydrolyticus TaxID=48074 RepID=A0A6P1TAH7_9GAMM|nr:hypothetical protein [Microbulbifer hydrolyticus]MBB5211623.1 hypothetical protein [Microbulbifer hydrolyticus]QHQ37642.1 hypothetical protein GTQ55_00700 [Microbulbifer hydrolyticus]
MTDVNKIQSDLDYIRSAVGADATAGGIPAVYFLWALLIPVGFSLPDFAPHLAGIYWLIVGTGGGLFSWWLGARQSRRAGVNNPELARRYGLHWCLVGGAFLLCFLPLVLGRVAPEMGGANFLLVTGIAYGLAGVHLERPLLWCGILMLVAYGILIVLMPPHIWTITGITVGLALCWAGFSRHAAIKAGDEK